MCLTSRDPPSDELWQMLCAHVGPTPNVVFVLNSVAVSKHCGCSNLFFGVAGGGRVHAIRRRTLIGWFMKASETCVW